MSHLQQTMRGMPRSSQLIRVSDEANSRTLSRMPASVALRLAHDWATSDTLWQCAAITCICKRRAGDVCQEKEALLHTTCSSQMSVSM